MKICEYCGKQIDYNHAYCNDECEDNTFLYYKNRKKFQTLFNVVTIAGVIAIMLGTFIGLISQILKVGLLVVGIALLLIGIVYTALPYYGIDEQIRKSGIVATIKTTRIIGIAVTIIGVVCTVFGIIVPF